MLAAAACDDHEGAAITLELKDGVDHEGLIAAKGNFSGTSLLALRAFRLGWAPIVCGEFFAMYQNRMRHVPGYSLVDPASDAFMEERMTRRKGKT